MHAPDDRLAPSRRRAGGLSGARLAGLFAALMLLALIPVVTHPLPPLSDYLNHLARTHVIATIGADSDFARFYTIDWQLIPNLMIDLVLPPLQRFMSVYAAGQMFTAASFVLIMSGTLALNRALFGRWSALPLIVSPLLYNGVLLVGVMNYVFGIGLALWALAGWVWLRERAWPGRFAIAMAAVLVLYVCHLFALGVYGLGLLGYEVYRLGATRGAPLGPRLLGFVAAGAPFLVVLALLVTSPTFGLADAAYWEPWGKLEGLMLAVNIYDRRLAYALVAATAIAGIWARWRGLLRLHPALWAMLAVGTVVYLAMPRAVFAANLADQRLPIALAFMLAACMQLDVTQRAVRRGLVALCVLLLAARVIEVQIVWDRLSRTTQAVRHAVLGLERGARLLVVHGDRSKGEEVSDLNLLHAASLATIERSALVSTAFAVPGKQVLRVRDEFRRFVDTTDRIPPSADWLPLAAGDVDETDRFYWSQWPRHFDDVIVLFTRRGDRNPDPRFLALIDEAPGFQLYRVTSPD